MKIISAQFNYDPYALDGSVSIEVEGKSGRMSVPYNDPDNRHSRALTGWVSQPGNKIKKAKKTKKQNSSSDQMVLLLDILVANNTITPADKKNIIGEVNT